MSVDAERVAFVTGAAGGIGSATVDRLLESGCAVVGFDLRSVTPTHPMHRHVVGDVRDAAALNDAVGRTVGEFGRLDAVVAAAAVIAGGHPLWQTPQTTYDDVMDVDARGVWLTAAATIPAILAGPDPSVGRFVAVASGAAHKGLFGLAAYNAAKHAVVGIVRGLAADLVNSGVAACAVSPGSTRTPMLQRTADLYGLADVEDFASHQLVGRLIEPDEVAAAITFCCSREGVVANGSVMHVGGGFA